MCKKIEEIFDLIENWQWTEAKEEIKKVHDKYDTLTEQILCILNDKYPIPGKDCECGASSEVECGCSNVDWATPEERMIGRIKKLLPFENL